ncbi:hypothetical protein [Rhizobium sp. CSW-27]|uniref:hypothetical protein n=1 Tax=Rhizobium sp. CSW-27 TaxID=2839985 RepID=UPI001C019F53|nr:hypothetical protein [Rhizobium sp. CSW-27]
MSLVVWAIIFGLVILTAYYTTRMAREREELDRHDPGLAILEFGRAYPTEAIRSLHETEDGNAIFVRLHDNKAGVMRNGGSHYACHLIEPGRAQVTPMSNGRGLTIDFLDAPTQSGSFVFSTAAEAAEVSLWLLGNYLTREQMQLDGVRGQGGSV